jgi:3-isopropylmalate/(R)-2-methylmalate dehydratase large subunit
VIEFAGPVVAAMDMESRMTLCNMAIEAGGTCGICAPDRVTVDYLWPFIKNDYDTPEAALAALQPVPAGRRCALRSGHRPRCVPSGTRWSPSATGRTTSNRAADMADTPVDQVYIGSCTNGRISDLRIAARVLTGKRISGKVRAIVSPATPEVYRQALAEGLIKIFMDAGFCVTNPTCGACLGMSNGVLADGEAAPPPPTAISTAAWAKGAWST